MYGSYSCNLNMHKLIFLTSAELKQWPMCVDISLATGVAEGTIRNSYKDLYPHVSKIIPNWYAKEEDLKNLCSP
jgi:hypothetical protein